MILLEDVYADDEYCEPTCKEPEINDKVIMGGFAVVMIVLAAIIWYGISMGVYIDPASLN